MFSEIPVEVLHEVSAVLEEEEVAAGEKIINKGDFGTCMYIIVTGKVRVIGLICALILSAFGCFIGLELHDYLNLGQLTWIVTLLLNATFCVMGYKLGMIIYRT